MGWTDVFSTKVEPRKLEDYVTVPPEVREHWDSLTTQQGLTVSQQGALAAIIGVTFAVGFKAGRMQPFWRRFNTVQDIPSSYFGDTAPWLRGRVLTVSDGDTVRFRHAPSRILHTSTLQPDEKVSSVALAIRICSIDTPETAKFGKPGQKFGQDAKEHLSKLVENKIVTVQLLQRDQYGRAVAQVRFPGTFPFTKKYADEEMLKAGLAEVYTGSGAVYGRLGKEAYLSMEEKASKNKKGMWKQKNRESAAEYKARLKAEE